MVEFLSLSPEEEEEACVLSNIKEIVTRKVRPSICFSYIRSLSATKVQGKLMPGNNQ